MKKKIFVYYINVLVLLLLATPSFAQKPKKEIKTPGTYYPLYNGVTVGVDLYGVGSKILGGKSIGSEVSIDVNLKNRFMPVVEAGYASIDTEEEGAVYKSAAPYFRIGMNYNTMFKRNSPNFLYVGARYGFCAANYDVKSAPLKDGLWPGEIPFDYQNEHTNAHWMELILGVKAQVYKNFMMGWSIRYKSRLSVSENPHSTPYYIPGFGENNTTNFGITYSLIYKLPL